MAVAPADTVPRLGDAVRESLSDCYYHSWRLVAANLLWGAALLASLAVVVVWPVALLVTVPLLGLATAAIYRIAALIVRDEFVSFWDGVRFARARMVGTAGAAVALMLGATVLVVNLISGLSSAEPLGWGLATLAGWGLVAVWSFALVFWPVFADPWRDGVGMGASARLAVMVVLAAPVRIAGLALFTAIVGVASTIAFAALLMVSVGFCAVLGARVGLPLADRVAPPALRPPPD